METTTDHSEGGDWSDAAARLARVLDTGDSVDLHSHSRHSDGDWTPTEIVHDAKQLGLTLLSLTDHDTVTSQEEAARAAVSEGILYLTGMEVSLTIQGRLYHVLCYDYDPTAPTWAAFAEARARRREKYQLDLFAQLATRGYDVSPDLARDPTGRFLANPLAEAVYRAGRAQSVEAAQQLVRGLYLRPRIEITYQDVEEFGSLLQPGDAVFSVAHPARQQQDVSVRLTEADLVTFKDTIPLVALEATHPYHSSADVVAFADLAAKHGLAVTCGSDAHGIRQRRPLQKYSAVLSRDFLEIVRRRWAERARAPVLVTA